MLTFVFSVAGDGESVGSQRSLHFGVVEVDDGSVILEHVDLLNAGDVVHSQLLQRTLQLLVVRGGRAVHHLLLPARRAGASDAHLRLQFGQLVSIHPANKIKKHQQTANKIVQYPPEPGNRGKT